MRTKTISIGNPDLIRRIAREASVRGSGTLARAAGDLLLERLTQLESERRDGFIRAENAK